MTTIQKSELFGVCKQILQEKMNLSKLAMEEAQLAANGEKGMMGDKFESFREQMQIERDRYAQRFLNASNDLAYFLKIDLSITKSIINLGCIVHTDFKIYFISSSIGLVKLDGLEIICISIQTPLYLAMKGKKVGDSFEFNQVRQSIKLVY